MGVDPTLNDNEDCKVRARWMPALHFWRGPVQQNYRFSPLSRACSCAALPKRDLAQTRVLAFDRVGEPGKLRKSALPD